MINIIKAEFIKSKRTSINKLVVITPVFAIILSFLLGGGISGAFNWWYVMFLPVILALIAAQTITRERNLSYKSIFLYPQTKGKIWLGKILYLGILLVITNIIFLLGIAVFSSIYDSTIPFNSSVFGIFVLICTFLFNLPIVMFLSAKFNVFVAVIFNLGMSIVGVVSYGTSISMLLSIIPYGTPSALMVPILGILPNGLPVTHVNPLLQNGILSSTLISVLVFIIVTVLTTLWFEKNEVH